MDNYLNRSKYKKVLIFRRTKMTQNYESLRIKASRLCPKSEFQDVTGQIKIPCFFLIALARYYLLLYNKAVKEILL